MKKANKPLVVFSTTIALMLVACGGTSSLTSANSSNNSSVSTSADSSSHVPVVSYGLEVTAPAKVTYNVGEKLDLTGLVVKLITTTDGVADVGTTLTSDQYKVKIGDEEVTGDYELKTPGTLTVKVLHTPSGGSELSAEFNVTVNSVVTKALIVDTLPTKVEYQHGEAFTAEGLVVKFVTTTDGVADNGVETNAYSLTINGESTRGYVFEPVGEETYVVTVTPTDTSITSTSFNVTASDSNLYHKVTLEGTGEMVLDWNYLIQGEGSIYTRGDAITDISKVKAGSIVGFNVNPESDYYVNWGDFTVTGASVARTTIGDDDFETFYFTVGSQDITLNVTNLKDRNPYTDKEFLGEYTIYDLSKKTFSTLSINADGTISYGERNITYTYDETKGTFTVETLYGTKYSLALEDNIVFFNVQQSYPGTTFVGAKGSQDTVSVKTHLVDGSEDLLELQVGDVVTPVMVYYDRTMVAPSDTVKFKYDGEDLASSTLVDIEVIADENGESILDNCGGSSSYYKETIDGVTYHHYYYKVLSSTTCERVDRGVESGTYTGDAGELVLDGFGKFTLGDKTGTYTYDKTNKVVTLTLSDETTLTYKLDTSAFTYQEFVVINSDPWVDSPATFVAEGKFEVTFNNGTVTLTSLDDNYWDVDTASYTVSNNLVKFTLTINDWYAYDCDVDFEFYLESDLSKMTLNKTASYGGWSSTTVYSKGLVVTAK